MITGTPVRRNASSYEKFAYPFGYSRTKKTILICGGSQGAQSMNMCLLDAVKNLIPRGFQVFWQTGLPGYEDIVNKTHGVNGLFIFPTIDDLYPYYAAAHIVIGRAGASTISEIAYFGLPCILIPLPWATENHQWINAGVVETQGWGVRVKQDGDCGAHTVSAVEHIFNDVTVCESMSRKALDHAPSFAAATIVKTIISDCNL
jgi:UDP-N-acetylglucosamine--N-acetylmuramyl-(pentapeptide) pyrophosphoryl-undecaprenol N-acetylglucosamine transferase